MHKAPREDTAIDEAEPTTLLYKHNMSRSSVSGWIASRPPPIAEHQSNLYQTYADWSFATLDRGCIKDGFLRLLTDTCHELVSAGMALVLLLGHCHGIKTGPAIECREVRSPFLMFAIESEWMNREINIYHYGPHSRLKLSFALSRMART